RAATPAASDRLRGDGEASDGAFCTAAVGAGDVEALAALVKALRPSPKLALLLSTTKSDRSLIEALASSTSIPIREVHHDTPLEAGNIYVAAPGAQLVVGGGRVNMHRGTPQSMPMPIDTLFRALAAD